MRFTSFIAVALSAFAVSAAPVLEARQSNSTSSGNSTSSSNSTSSITDVDVLQFALTLERLEIALYKQGLSQFSDSDFQNAGLPSWVRLRFTEIISQETQHIAFISNAISASGATPNQACTYKFPFTSVQSWLTLTQTIDGVGPNAYLGASGLLSNKQTLTYAASILTVESRHNTWVRSAAQNEDGFPTPFEQPLTVNQVYTLASAFITSCPSSNAPLKAQAFPALTVSPNGTAQPGDTLTLTANTTLPSSGLYAVFLANNAPVAVQTDGKSVQVPSQQAVQGQTYLVLSTSQNVTDSSIVAGPQAVNVASPAKLYSYQGSSQGSS